MEKELDADVIKTTQISLGKYVKRPPLSEKLLKKPPFRFLHDIITTVLKTTGFFENLFDEEELVSDNVKDREGKILFLNKVIFVLSSTTGKSLAAKPSKIVAGQEPDKTNELLQCLALALDKKYSSEKAVKKYKESLEAPQAVDTKAKDSSRLTKRGNDAKKLASRSSEKLTMQKNDATRGTSKNDKDKTTDGKSKKKEISIKTEPQSKKIQQTRASTKRSVNIKGMSNDSEKLKKNLAPNIKDLKPPLPKLESQNTNLTEDNDEQIDLKLQEHLTSPRQEQEGQINLNDSYTIGDHDLNLTSSSQDLIQTTNVIVEDKTTFNNKTIDDVVDADISTTKEDNVQDIELSSDYKDTPKRSIIVDNFNNEPENKTMDSVINNSNNTIKSPPISVNDSINSTVRPQSVRPSSSRPGAPRMREKLDNVGRDSDTLLLGKVNIIVENTQNEEDEETSLVVIEQQTDLSSSNNQQELTNPSTEHGHLVQQILDSQKELSQLGGKTEIEWQFGAQKAREAMNQEVEQLRFNIQALSRVANPLGKLLDHIQEDVEVMRQELQQWTNIYDEVTKEMVKQKTLNEDSLLPLHTKLKQLERDIEDKYGKINDLKILVHKNANRIEKLLANGNVQ